MASVPAALSLFRKESAPKTSDLRILLVEDDEADLYLIGRALSENTRVEEVLVARDGEEALERLSATERLPDLAIVDLKLPRKDGFALLREFSARYPAKLPAFVLSSSRAGADVYRAKKRGALEFIAKPSNAAQLRSSIDLLIETACAAGV